MNKRIRELYLQAHSIRYHDGDPMRDGNPPTVYWQDEVSAQRFAELIVRGCAESLWTEECYNSDLALEEFEKNSEKIREHFGVEE
jgi:hypothetical protein